MENADVTQNAFGTDLYISKTENRICNTQIVRIFMWVIRGQWYNAI